MEVRRQEEVTRRWERDQTRMNEMMMAHTSTPRHTTHDMLVDELRERSANLDMVPERTYAIQDHRPRILSINPVRSQNGHGVFNQDDPTCDDHGSQLPHTSLGGSTPLSTVYEVPRQVDPRAIGLARHPAVSSAYVPITRPADQRGLNTSAVWTTDTINANMCVLIYKQTDSM